MKPFGETFEEPRPLFDAKDAADAGSSVLAGAGGAARSCVPVVSLAVAVALLFAVVLQSGGHTTVEAAPKALLVVFGGLKGTTFDEIGLRGHRAPNLAALARAGQHSACLSPSDTRCCRAQSGRRLGGAFEWDAAPGVASIVTGVDAIKHGVYNDSYKAMAAFGASSRTFPSIFATVTESGLRAAAVGSGPMLTAVGPGGKCSDYGVLDFECGADLSTRCLVGSSCNLDARVSYSTPDRRTHDRNAGLPAAGAVDGSEPGPVSDDSHVVQDVEGFIDGGASLVGVHLAMPRDAGPSAAGNPRYAADLYRADAVLGRVLAAVRERAALVHENWLVLVVGDSGGDDNLPNDADLVAFVGAVVTAGGPLRLRAPTVPTRQFDAAPTVLRWLGLLTPAAELRMDGRVQLLCSSGKEATNCTDI